MTSRHAVALVLCAMAAACSSGDGPPLSVSNVVIAEPLPGASVTSGYMTIDNNSEQAITIEKITSPQFSRVEMHQTVLEDDVARMLPLAPLIIDRRSSVRFEPGGKHLMLSGWPHDLAARVQITLEFHYDGSGLLIVSTIVATNVSPTHELPVQLR